MTDAPNINIDTRKLFNMGVNLLVAGFINQPQDQAKKLFKDLKNGKTISVGQLNAEKSNLSIPIKLELERTDYRGQFNFPNFDTCLRSLLNQCQIKVRQDKELKELGVRTNQSTGGLLFNIAGPSEIDGNVNVLMMGVEPGDNALVVRLVFFDSEQFIRKDEDADQPAS